MVGSRLEGDQFNPIKFPSFYSIKDTYDLLHSIYIGSRFTDT